jgi:hypothetical protein
LHFSVAHFSSALGEILWVFDAATVPNAGGGNGGPAIYEIDGVEYVVYGFGGNPGTSFQLGDAVIAFALPSAMAAAAAKTAAADKALAQRGGVRQLIRRPQLAVARSCERAAAASKGK